MTRSLAKLVLVGVALTGARAQAAEPPPEVEVCPAREARTVFIADATMRRQDGSADRITRSHREQEKQGWQFEDLEIYIENGDLQGFFVTYTRPHPCNDKG